ncbi:MAG: hypothetical protein V3R57_02840, partial [Candidatus Bathyarchaeia archaeon]
FGLSHNEDHRSCLILAFLPPLVSHDARSLIIDGGRLLLMEIVYLLAYGMLVKRNGGIRFLVTFWDRVGGCFH